MIPWPFALLCILSLPPVLARAATDPAVAAFEKSCDAGDGLACAKAGYHHKKTDPQLAFKYYEKGCKLQDSSSCFNVEGLNPRDLYFQKADGIMKFSGQNIVNCHRPDVKLKSSAMQYKSVWHRASFKIRINREGRADSVDVTTDLPKSFIECSKGVVKAIRFPIPDGILPSYDYSLTIESYQ